LAQLDAHFWRMRIANHVIWIEAQGLLMMMMMPDAAGHLNAMCSQVLPSKQEIALLTYNSPSVARICEDFGQQIATDW
jgi:hypothetical protein